MEVDTDSNEPEQKLEFNGEKVIKLLQELRKNIPKEVWEENTKEIIKYCDNNEIEINKDNFNIFYDWVQTTSPEMQEYGIRVGLKGMALDNSKSFLDSI